MHKGLLFPLPAIFFTAIRIPVLYRLPQLCEAYRASLIAPLHTISLIFNLLSLYVFSYMPLNIEVNNNTNTPKDRLVFTNIKIVSGFGAKGANLAERMKLTQTTMRTIINAAMCLPNKTIPRYENIFKSHMFKGY